LDKLDEDGWEILSQNPNVINILEKIKKSKKKKHLDKVNWVNLSMNRNAIHILEKNLDKSNWWVLNGVTNLNKLVYLKIY